MTGENPNPNENPHGKKDIKVGFSLEEILGGSANAFKKFEDEKKKKSERKKQNQEILFENKKSQIIAILRQDDIGYIITSVNRLNPILENVNDELEILFSIINYVKEKLIETSDEFFEFFEYILESFSNLMEYYKEPYEKQTIQTSLMDYIIKIFDQIEYIDWFSITDLNDFLEFVLNVPEELISVRSRLDLNNYLLKQVPILVLKYDEIEPLNDSIMYFVNQDRSRNAIELISKVLDSIGLTYIEYITKPHKFAFFSELMDLIQSYMEELEVKEEFFIPAKLKILEIFNTWLRKKEKIIISREEFNDVINKAKIILNEEDYRKIYDEFNVFTKNQVKFLR